ncbi:DUF2497 domain-containing protein [Sphingomonas baiyangensis]|uniref:DUF2497 domain-containing protein n=1 Tax=Sphingomonas baiyangensis TaxID=2572576 RepID=A0A4U1L1T4_9SPHN|nr:DUF2497 domain-containing protein [Sphingomonas baiyangensis]TKD50811.1 DUF2497 domain-containing protein [Sphingomonas baiyangensis]
MEDILSSIKRIIAEEGDGAVPGRGRRIARPAEPPRAQPLPVRDDETEEAVLELDQSLAAQADPAPAPQADPAPETAPRAHEREETMTHDPAILSAHVAQATRGKLDALSRLVVKPEVTGADTLEGLVREMLRPMLSQWLDANLPRIVETMVSREIARISGRDD